MLLRFAITSLFCLALVTPAFSGEGYSFITSSEGVKVVCQADAKAYVTSRLRGRQKVTAYHQQNGFLAIRPPKGAYSWVAMHHVQRSSNPHIGIVLRSGAKSYIAADRNETQVDLHSVVELKRGERVHILGVQAVQTKKNGQPERCFKIAPPPGEFRWVAMSDVNGPIPQSLPKLITNAMTERLERPSDSTAAGDAGKTGVKQASSQSAKDQNKVAISDDSKGAPPEQKMDRVADLQIIVTQTVLQPIANWDLEAIRDRTIDRVKNGATALERGQARLLLERIDRFRAAQERWFNQSKNQQSEPADDAATKTDIAQASFFSPDKAGAGNTVIATPNAVTASPPKAITAPLPSSPYSLLDTDFGKLLAGAAAPARPKLVRHVGYLVEVRYDSASSNRKQVLPKFAIVDKNQKVQQYILPVPGLNLYGFRNRRVSVGGNFIRVKGFDKPILVVENVARLRE